MFCFIVLPLLGSTVGDPHITTYDGLNYDYNGIGEYWLIKSSALHVQVRTVQAKDGNGQLVKASVFGAFTLQVPQGLNQNVSDKMHLKMVSESSKLYRIVTNIGLLVRF